MEQLDRLDADDAADEAADKKIEPHLEIHVPDLPVGIGAGGGRGHDLVRIGCGRHGGRNAEHDEKRRQKKTAAHAEQAGKQAHGKPEPHGDQDVDAGQCYW